ncbi:gamma-glutamylcyclotransferase family protein [Mariniflexile litorale]|uniref:Gamma-glutamylcyclotransferase family protein n=1 Tax=Mariniflexile litorale TaxID=3045158 RepID=A0AAU7EFL7_9FLAO|nr:gamma-glutamylcyclotransferase family protein [Mariniflexile sp. KMM 9835]MDQ8211860.1 gamma-glutamylcyclotransferase [Mariniflexile sp. KMM 9835]
MESEYLFVYGTLLKDFESYMSKFLEQNSEFVGAGYFNGNLYKISWYPGAVLSDKPSDKVYGHIFKIFNKEKTFKVLDDYEGIGDTGEHANEYTRTLIDAYLETNETVKTWMYSYNLPTTHLQHIPSGKYV